MGREDNGDGSSVLPGPPPVAEVRKTAGTVPIVFASLSCAPTGCDPMVGDLLALHPRGQWDTMVLL